MLEQLLNKEKTFKAILENVPNGILVMDINSKDVVLANKEMELIASNDKDPMLTFKERISNFLMSKKVFHDEGGHKGDHSFNKHGALDSIPLMS